MPKNLAHVFFLKKKQFESENTTPYIQNALISQILNSKNLVYHSYITITKCNVLFFFLR